jgi:DNA-binding transcriptional regulator YiaG
MNFARHKPGESAMRAFRVDKGLTRVILGACGLPLCEWSSIEKKMTASTHVKERIRGVILNGMQRGLIDCTEKEIDELLNQIQPIQKDFKKRKKNEIPEAEENDPKPEEMTPGWYFLQMRQARHLTQKQWAQMLGVHHRTVQRMENNQGTCMENEILIIEGLKRLGYNKRVKHQLFGTHYKNKPGRHTNV